MYRVLKITVLALLVSLAGLVDISPPASIGVKVSQRVYPKPSELTYTIVFSQS